MSLLDGPIVQSIETLTLERLKFGLQTNVGAQVRGSLHAQVAESILGDLVYRLTADILAEKLPPETVARSKTFTVSKVPTSSWQHFKSEHPESWWLGWLVRRRPVEYREIEFEATLTVDLDRYRTFPQCNYTFPKDLGPYVQVAMVRDHWSVR